VNLVTDTVSRWIQIRQSGKNIKVGDFGPTDYFYGGGVSTDLCIVPASASGVIDATLQGSYLSEDIVAVRVFNGISTLHQELHRQPS